MLLHSIRRAGDLARDALAVKKGPETSSNGSIQSWLPHESHINNIFRNATLV